MTVIGFGWSCSIVFCGGELGAAGMLQRRTTCWAGEPEEKNGHFHNTQRVDTGHPATAPAATADWHSVVAYDRLEGRLHCSVTNGEPAMVGFISAATVRIHNSNFERNTTDCDAAAVLQCRMGF